jgi:hypothetical protein
MHKLKMLNLYTLNMPANSNIAGNWHPQEGEGGWEGGIPNGIPNGIPKYMGWHPKIFGLASQNIWAGIPICIPKYMGWHPKLHPKVHPKVIFTVGPQQILQQQPSISMHLVSMKRMFL